MPSPLPSRDRCPATATTCHRETWNPISNGRWDRVSNATPFCPVCGSALALSKDGEFNPWVCPNGHGLAATTSEAYEKAQEDELDLLWALAKKAAPGTRACPMCEQPMVVVDLAWDGDEVSEGRPGDGPDEGHESLDVCVRDEVVWFDAGELDALPADLADAEPTAEQMAQIKQAADALADEIVAGERAEEDHTITGWITNRVLSRSRTARRMVENRAAHVQHQLDEADHTV